MSLRHSLKSSIATLSAFVALVARPAVVFAQGGIKNPVIGKLGDDVTRANSGALFISYFINLWRVVISLGSVLVMVYFIWGSIDWITSGGDKGKTEAARNKITQAAIGLIVLVSSFTLVGFIGKLFFGTDFDVLKLTLPTPTGGTL
jgi:NADH:ubiquinone oxidoreductase subunit 6 (subunit J)